MSRTYVRFPEGARVTVAHHQELPRSGEEREALRERGQFWTPDWVAEAMVRFALSNRSRSLLDPAVGPGTFLIAAQRLRKLGLTDVSHFTGFDIDPEVMAKAQTAGGGEFHLEQRDFVACSPESASQSSIVANPPYIRHHRIPGERKDELRSEVLREHNGLKLDGRVGFHYYFFLTALRSLAPSGKLCFIMSADTAEGVSAKKMWREIVREFRLDAVVTFRPEATPFPGVDTNAVIYCISKEPPAPEFVWMEVSSPTDELGPVLAAVGEGSPIPQSSDIKSITRGIDEAVSTGLSRPPFEGDVAATFGDFVSVMRGVVAGDSEFFFLTDEQAKAFELPESSLTGVVVRTRNVRGDTFTTSDFENLGALGQPRWLFSADEFEDGDDPVSKYIREGISRGLPEKPILAARGTRWYRSERRIVPDFLFAYLGRRNQRFIFNDARVIPSTAFLCVYVRPEYQDQMDRIRALVGDSSVIDNLRYVAKSYGGGALKVEPRSLERLPLSLEQLTRAGLSPPNRLC